MVDFHDRRVKPVTDVVNSLHGDGKRYRVSVSVPNTERTEMFTGQEEGYLGPSSYGVAVTKSSRSRGSVIVPHEHITKIEEAKTTRNGRKTLYLRPDHVQSGYGRV